MAAASDVEQCELAHFGNAMGFRNLAFSFLRDETSVQEAGCRLRTAAATPTVPPLLRRERGTDLDFWPLPFGEGVGGRRRKSQPGLGVYL